MKIEVKEKSNNFIKFCTKNDVKSDKKEIITKIIFVKEILK